MSNVGSDIRKSTIKKLRSMEGPIKSREDLQTAIDLADLILVQPRYGLSETWVSINQTEAEYLVGGTEEIHAEVGADLNLYLGIERAETL